MKFRLTANAPILPPGYPNYSATTIEFVGSKAVVLIDDRHKDLILNTMDKGMMLPMALMPGEAVEHAFAGPMQAETIHFLDAVARDKPVLVTAEQAHRVMEVYLAADLSAERNEPVSLLLNRDPESISASA